MSKPLNKLVRSVLKLRGFSHLSFKHNGHPVYFFEGGQKKGPKLLILPGYGDTFSSWAPLLLRYANRFHIYILDFPGYTGFSPSPHPKGQSVTFDGQEKTLEHFFHNHVKHANFVIGNSLGGWLGIRLAHHHPKAIEHVIAINPGGLLPHPENREIIRDLYNIRDYSDFIRLMKKMWHKLPAHFYPFSLLGFYQYTTEPEFGKLLDTLTEEHFLDRILPKMNTPIDIIWGTSDKLFAGIDIGKIIATLAKNGRYFPIPKAGHMPHLERPVLFFETLDLILFESKSSARYRT